MDRDKMRARELRDDARTLRDAAKIMRRRRADTQPSPMAAFGRRLAEQADLLEQEATVLDPRP